MDGQSAPTAYSLCLGRRSRARVFTAGVVLWVGGYTSYRRVDFSRVGRLVFACTGNICRSPYAEFRALGEGVDAVSFGLDTTPGLPANETAMAAAARRGLDLSTARTKGIAAVSLDEGDLLVGMTPAHGVGVKALVEATGAQVTLLGLWGELRMPYLPDPYGCPPEIFDRCYSVIDIAVEDLCARVLAAKSA